MAFSGFPAGKVKHTPVPASFFSELLPSIEHLGELKLTIYIFWHFNQMEGRFRYFQRADLLTDNRFIAGMGATRRAAEIALDESLERAVSRGTLLAADLTLNLGQTRLYFLNSPRGQAAIKGLQQGKWHPKDLPTAPIALDLERPNIFRLYEAHIGPLTPLIADTLREAEETYPIEWIEDALQIAVENNVRRWRYVAAILQSWQEQGRNDSNTQPDSQADRLKYFDELAKRIGQ